MAKKTVKDLNQDFSILKEMLELLNLKHEEREKTLEARIDSRKVTPIPIIFKGFDIFGRRIGNDNFEHGSPNNVDKSADADAYVDDVEV